MCIDVLKVFIEFVKKILQIDIEILRYSVL